MINSVNNVNFKGWKQDIKSLFPRKLVGYSTHTPKIRPYRELEFMPELQEKNPLKKFLNSIIEKFSQYKK